MRPRTRPLDARCGLADTELFVRPMLSAKARKTAPEAGALPVLLRSSGLTRNVLKIFVSWCLRGSFCLVESVTNLTNELVASYARVGGINHLDGKNLPSKRAITAITMDLLRLLFPGFYDETLVHSSEIRTETAALLDSILGRLEDEI